MTIRGTATRIFGRAREASIGTKPWNCCERRVTSRPCSSRSKVWRVRMSLLCRQMRSRDWNRQNNRNDRGNEKQMSTQTQLEAPVSTIAEIGKHEGQAVTIPGWLYNLRERGKLLFPQFRDGSGFIQGVVAKNQVSPEIFDTIKTLTQESSVIVKGTVRADKRAKGGYELDVQEVRVVEKVPEDTPYPISLKEHGVDFLMEHRHLWVRSPRQVAILRIRAEIIKAARDFFDERGFTLTDPPILTPAACEGTSTLFEVDYFDDQAYLTQSGQLYIEATAIALGKVYSFGPTFRAEKSKTRRHLTEFWMVEPEVAYAELDDVMELAENFITFIVKRVLKNRRA